MAEVQGLLKDGRTMAEAADIIEAFLEAYERKPADMSDEVWLAQQLEGGAVMSTEDAARAASELCEAVDLAERAERRAQNGVDKGETIDDWLRRQVSEQRDKPEWGDADVFGRLTQMNDAFQSAWQRPSKDDDRRHGAAVASGFTATGVAGLDAMTPPLQGTEVYGGLTQSLQMEYQHTMQHDFGLMNLQDDLVENALDQYAFGDIVSSLSKNAALAGGGGLAIASGLMALQDIRKGRFSVSETLMKSWKNGQTAGLKIAVSGALRVCTERRLVTLLGTRTPAVIYVGVASLGIEGTRVMHSCLQGEITRLQAADRMGRNSLSIVLCIGFSTQGAALGAASLAIIPVVGPIAGSILGGMVGSVVGTKLAQREWLMAKKAYSSLSQTIHEIEMNDIRALRQLRQAKKMALAYAHAVTVPQKLLWAHDT